MVNKIWYQNHKKRLFWVILNFEIEKDLIFKIPVFAIYV